MPRNLNIFTLKSVEKDNFAKKRAFQKFCCAAYASRDPSFFKHGKTSFNRSNNVTSSETSERRGPEGPP